MNIKQIQEAWQDLVVARDNLAQSTKLGTSNDLAESKIEKLAPLIVDSSIHLILKMKEKANFFKDTSLCESVEIHKQNLLTLDQMFKDVDLFKKSELKELENISIKQSLSQKVEALLGHKDALVKHLHYNDEMLEYVGKHIKGRKQFVKEMMPRLEHLTPGYVDGLEDMLKKYDSTGNGDELLKHNRLHQESKPGSTGNSLVINKMLVQLIDAKRLLPKDYVAGTKKPEEKIDLHELALSYLTGEGFYKEAAYAKAIDDLYQKVEDMRVHGDSITLTHISYGTTVTLLAEALKEDIDRFLVEHKGAKPDEDSFNRLKEIFNARLNSKNDEMSQHRAIWKPIVANILIGLATLGIALLVQYFNTKTFFFTKTRREEHIEEIGNAFNTITVS